MDDPNHIDPTHPSYEPHPHLSLLHPVQSLLDTEKAAEYAIVYAAFGIIAHLPAGKSEPSPFMTMAKNLGMSLYKFYNGFSQCNSSTNGLLKPTIVEQPIDLLYGGSVYAATLAATELTEFAAHQMHVHADTGAPLNLPRIDPRHGAFACPDE